MRILNLIYNALYILIKYQSDLVFLEEKKNIGWNLPICTQKCDFLIDQQALTLRSVITFNRCVTSEVPYNLER